MRRKRKTEVRSIENLSFETLQREGSQAGVSHSEMPPVSRFERRRAKAIARKSKKAKR